MPPARARHIVVAGRKWTVYDFIAFFYDRNGIFEQCVSREVLSRIEQDGNQYHITQDECESYLKLAYGRVAIWEGT